MQMTTNTDHVIRSNLWSSEIKDVLYSELMGLKYIKWLEQFPDGDTFNIPSVGTLEINDYVEGNQITYTGLDTGNFTFSIDTYKAAGFAITNKLKQDSMYMNDIARETPAKQARALAEAMEAKMFSVAVDGQTSASTNLINGAKHRLMATGSNNVLRIDDFSFAKYALKKANVPLNNLIAIVSPESAVAFERTSNLTNLSNNPQWQGVITTGMSTGMQFKYNIMGFDVYESNFLKTGAIGSSETLESVALGSNHVNNLFFSAASDVLPIIGAIRQAPKVDSEYNKDLQRDEYVTTARYGFKLFRPENMVTIVSATNQVYV